MDYGLHRIPAAQYHALPQLSASRLRYLAKSPAHLQHSLSEPYEQTDAQALGQAVHTLVLEPELFDSQNALMPKFDRRTKEGKAGYAQWISFNEGKQGFCQSDWEAIQAMAKAVAAHPKAAPLVGFAELIEQSVIWRHPSGVDCKSRIDAICPELATIFDLKTTRDASPHAFSKAIFDYGYYRQGAFYIDACRSLGIQIDHYAIIAIENTAPYPVTVYRLLDESIELGRKENDALIELYRTCKEADSWPGYPTEIQDIGLPAWAKNRITEDLRR